MAPSIQLAMSGEEDPDSVEQVPVAANASKLRQSCWKQYLASGVVSSLGGVTDGVVMGFSAILLPQLEEENERFSAESGEASWIASLNNIGTLISSPFVGILLTQLGRRGTLLALCLPSCAGWALVATSKGTLGWMCAGRILQGVGGFSSAMQLYMIEIADVKNRGIIGSFGALSVAVGITLVYILGACLPWRTVVLICGTLPTALFFLLPFIPETPNWLATRDRENDARKSLRWLRGRDSDVEQEMKTLFSSSSPSRAIKDQREGEDVKVLVPKRGKKDHEGRSSVWKSLGEFRHRRSYRPLVILLSVFVLMQWSGSFAVIFYAVNLFSALGVSSDAYASAITVGAVRFIGTLLSTVLLSSCSRRHLMLASSALTALSMGALAAVAPKEASQESASSGALPLPDEILNVTVSEERSGNPPPPPPVLSIYLPVALVVLYMLAFGVGVGTVPWILLGELCPARTKGLSSGVVTSVSFGCVFLVVKLFPFFTSSIGLSSTFALFSSVCVVNFAFCLFFLPETKGKTLAEVQNMFDK